MPSNVVKSYAEKSGKSESEVDAIWNEVKKQAKEKFKEEDSHFWAYVNAVTKKKCGIKEGISFKEYILFDGNVV